MPSASAVCRARVSGLVRITAGCTPCAASSSPSPRAWRSPCRSQLAQLVRLAGRGLRVADEQEPHGRTWSARRRAAAPSASTGSPWAGRTSSTGRSSSGVSASATSAREVTSVSQASGRRRSAVGRAEDHVARQQRGVLRRPEHGLRRPVRVEGAQPAGQLGVQVVAIGRRAAFGLSAVGPDPRAVVPRPDVVGRPAVPGTVSTTCGGPWCFTSRSTARQNSSLSASSAGASGSTSTNSSSRTIAADATSRSQPCPSRACSGRQSG